MSTPVMLRSNYSDLFGSGMLPVLEELFRSDLKRHPSRRETLFATKGTDRDIWQYSETHDLPLISEVPKGTQYSYQRSRQGFDKTFAVVKYGSGFSISMEAVEDGKFEMIGDLVRKLSKSAMESQEIQAMSIFNNGFTSETSADGVSVFNTAHLLPGGGTFRNKLTTDADLSESSLQTAMSDFETVFVGDTGIIENMRPKYLICHPSNKRLARELVGSEGKPDTADNNLNSLKEDGLIVISSPHLTDTDAWVLQSEAPETGLRIINRSGIQTSASDPAVGFHTDSIYYKARYREKVGVTHAKGILGSAGA